MSREEALSRIYKIIGSANNEDALLEQLINTIQNEAYAEGWANCERQNARDIHRASDEGMN